MTLPLSFDPVLRAFGHPRAIPVCDATGRYAGGRWTEDLPIRRARPLRAIVLATDSARLDFQAEGESSASSIVLHTREVLYFTDLTAHGIEQTQSYVLYQGFRYRVTGDGFMIGNAGFNTYNAVRYLL